MTSPPVTSQHVQQALRGDRTSLGWVVERFTPLLRAQAVWRLGPRLASRVDADDIVAEAWLVALRRLHELDRDDGHSTRRLLSFLGTTILHISNHRIAEAVRRASRVAPAPERSDAPGPVDALEASITGAVTHAMRTELATRLDACLASLDERDRQVILMRAVEGLANVDVAAQLGETPTAVSHRYRRAIAKLRGNVPESVIDDLLDD